MPFLPVLAVLKTKLVCSSAVVSIASSFPPLDDVGDAVPMPTLLLLSTCSATASSVTL